MLERLRQEDCHEIEASLGYIVSTRPAKALQKDPISKRLNCGAGLGFNLKIGTGLSLGVQQRAYLNCIARGAVAVFSFTWDDGEIG